MTETRTPAESRSPRMDNLARLPVFYALAGKRVVVAGGRPAAAWKVELLSATGANVHVFTAEASPELRELADDPPNGAIWLNDRDWIGNDLAGAAIAVGDFSDDQEAARFAAAGGKVRRIGYRGRCHCDPGRRQPNRRTGDATA